MKTMILAVMLICGSALAGAANARKDTIWQFRLQDDETGSHFTLDSGGTYEYVGCGNDIKLEGVGNVKFFGCIVTFEAINRSPLVQAEIDLCKRAGRASLLLDGLSPTIEKSKPIQFIVIDSDMSNNTSECK